MECKNTYSNNQSRAAMTLIEMMVAVGLGSIVLMVLASLTLYSAHSFSSMVNYTDLNQESRRALDRISKEIRQSRGLIERTPTSLAFQLNDGSQISYAYDAKSKIITEIKGAEPPQIVLHNCTFWTNEVFQQSPIPGNFDFVPTENPALCKMVQINWLCSIGTHTRTNSAEAQSMKVVIRKQTM